MTTLQTLDSSIISLILLTIIGLHSYHKRDVSYLPNRLFGTLLLANMALIVIDISGWMFNALPGPLYLFLNKATNLLLYITEPLAPLLWVLYTHFQIFRDERKVQRVARVMAVLFCINAVFSVWSLQTGWFFAVDEQNVYRRGDYFFAHVAYCYSLFAYYFWLVLRHRNIIERDHYYSLLLFFFPSLTGSLIQVLHYGVSYNWIGMTLSILIVYLTIQDRRLNTDYLTGVYNRRQLDRYLSAKINNSQRTSFAAILIDLNKFKLINDQFGHTAGDEALKHAVTLFRQSLQPDDFIARLGGDEFVIILDIASRRQLEEIVRKLDSQAQQFNRLRQQPYTISFSMGYDLYHPAAKMTAKDFLRHIDRLMYSAKQSLKIL